MTAVELVFQSRNDAGARRNALGAADGHNRRPLGIPRSRPSQPARLRGVILFGIFYRLNPKIEANRLALPQVWIWIVSTVVLAIGVGLVHTGHPTGEPVAAVGSFAIFADAIVFTWLVFQASPEASQTEGAHVLAPLE